MKLDITGRNIEITAALREFTKDKLSKLDKWIDEVIETHVILSIEKHRHMAEIVLKTRHHAFTGTDETGDMYASIGNAVDKLEKQAHKAKDRDTGRRKHQKPPSVVTLIEPVNESGKDGSSPGADGMPRIIRANEFSRKPLSIEDAALKFLESDRVFLVYRDARSQRISVMYRRKDGNLGLIEPEA